MNTTMLAELDLAIPDMMTVAAESQARLALRHLPGIKETRLMAQGAWISYDPAAISHSEIVEALRESGLRAGTFQDSATGKLGHYTA